MIGIYAHHQGSGHMNRARSIRDALGVDAQILSTDPSADVVLPDDADTPDRDPTARGTLHYVPRYRAGLADRMAMIADWIRDNRPSAFVVDVSVEVALLARLMGISVVTIAMPGVREDAPHQLGYTQADAIIAAWPDWVETPAHLLPHEERLHPVGGISRFDGAEYLAPVVPGDGHRVVVLSGRGGDDWSPENWLAVQRACPDHRFVFLGRDSFVDDPMPYLRSTDVVIAAAGQNSVADIAVAGTNAILLPQERPFGEQYATAALLDAAGLAVVADSFPAPEQWPDLLRRATMLEPDWESWQTSGAAGRAAEVIRKVAGL